MILGVSFLLAQFSAWAAVRARIPGGAMIAALVVTAAIGQVAPVAAPGWADAAITIVLSTVLGVRVDRRSLAALRPILIPATAAATVLIVVGLLSAGLLRLLGFAPVGDTLATSPGAIAVMSAAAIENRLDAPVVVLYQTVRVIAVIMTVPLVGLLIPASGHIETEDPTIDATATETPGDAGGATVAGWVDRNRALPVLGGAVAGMLVADALGIALPLVLSSFLGAALSAAAFLRRPLVPPVWMATGTQAGFGWLIGGLVGADVIRGLGAELPGAVLSATLLILAGILSALVLRWTGRGVAGDVLATSPGALEALTLAAADRGRAPLEVALFHLVRLLVVFATLPLLLALTLRSR